MYMYMYLATTTTAAAAAAAAIIYLFIRQSTSTVRKLKHLMYTFQQCGLNGQWKTHLFTTYQHA